MGSGRGEEGEKPVREAQESRRVVRGGAEAAATGSGAANRNRQGGRLGRISAVKGDREGPEKLGVK